MPFEICALCAIFSHLELFFHIYLYLFFAKSKAHFRPITNEKIAVKNVTGDFPAHIRQGQHTKMHSFLACDSSASSNYYFNCGNQRVIVTLALAPMSLADVHRVHPALHIYLGNLKAMYSFFYFLPMTRIFGSNLKFLIVRFSSNTPHDLT